LLGIQYDAAGNLTAIGAFAFEYDAENRLVSSTLNSVTTTYAYDGEGRRVKKGSVVMVYDAFGRLAAEYGGTAEPVGTEYLTADHLGSTRLVTSAAGAERRCLDYLPFGEQMTQGMGTRGACYASATEPRVKFTGKERDQETGLDYFGARYFSGAQGRWTSPDPINLAWDRLGNPISTLNKYVYAANNPLKFTDPDGQDVTLFYRASARSTDFGDYGHVFLAAYDQSTNQVEFLDFYPAGDLQRQGLEMVGPGAVNTGTFGDRRSGFASLTIQTTPEITQKVMQFMREFKANPPAYRFPSNTCVTACRAALEIAGIRVSAYSPAGIWGALYRRYSPSYVMMLSDGKSFMPPIRSRPGMDSGSPRTDPKAWQRFLFNLWLEQVRRQREEEERKKRERHYEPPGFGR
jgi:RHS repeat-associated protein